MENIKCADLDDVNIDGFHYRNDVVTTNLGSGDLTRQRGFVDAGSGFEGMDPLSGGAVPAALAIGDLDYDKTPDIVVANKGAAGLSVLLANPQAQSMRFGVGCAGTGGLVPDIGSTNLPVVSSTDFSVDLANARTWSPVLLAVGVGRADLDLGAGCMLYPDPLLVAGPFLTDGAGEFSLTIPQPTASSVLYGCDVFFQWGVVDPNGALGGVFALSDAVRTKVAN